MMKTEWSTILQDSFDMLVTALEANSDVPDIETVILYQEKLNERGHIC